MRGHKRKAENQLTKAVPSQCDFALSQSAMATAYGIGSTLWNWCKSVIVQGNLLASTSPVRAVTSKTHDNHGSSHDTGHDTGHETSHNPHGFCDALPSLSRSKSMTNLNSIEHREILDISECDVDQARQRIDQFWEPKPMPWSSQSVIVDRQPSAIESPKNPEGDSELQLSSLKISDSSKITSNFDLSFQPFKLDREFKNCTLSHDRQHYHERIKASLENLLIESPKQLKISEFKKAKNITRAKERAERDRLNAIKESKQRRLRRIYPKHTLVQYLDPYWEDRIQNVHSLWGEDVLTTSIGGTELRIKDFKTLLDCRAWLNDEIINAYIEWIVDAANKAVQEEYFKFGIKPTSFPKFIAHNSFFYETLKKRGPASLDRLMKRKGAPGLALLDVDTVFVPICSGSHWTLGVIRPIAKTIEYFDSMGGNPSTFVYNIQEWLKHQLGTAYSPTEWTTPKTECVNQTNGYDCGVFVCTNAFCVAVGLETSCYQECEMTQQRKNIAAILLNRGFNGEFAWKLQEKGLFY